MQNYDSAKGRNGSQSGINSKVSVPSSKGGLGATPANPVKEGGAKGKIAGASGGVINPFVKC